MRYRSILTRIVVYGVYGACLLLYGLFQGYELDWMDTASSADAPVDWGDNGSSNRSVIRGITVALALGVQLLIYSRFSRLETTVTSILLGTVLIVFW